jgi:phenylacetate-CoA ligase
MNSWEKQEIEAWQNKKFCELMHHFYSNSLYFEEIMHENGLSIEDFKSIKDIKKLPVLDKDTILKNYARLIPVNIKSIKHKSASTGGSTGNPLKFFIDYESWSYTTAVKIVNWQISGYLYGDRYAVLGSASLFPVNKKSVKHSLYFILKRALPLNGINLSDEVIKVYVGKIKSKKIKFLYGYASALYLIAHYVNKNNIDLNIKGCFPTSEILTDQYKEEIIKAFRCVIMDSYGARDGGINAFEIKEGIYHVGYNSYAEILNPLNDNSGILLVTDLLNKAFPFIRYKLGDEVVMGEKNGNFSYNGQVFKKILGRISSVLRLDNGRVLTGPGFTILFKDLNVIAYRTSLIHGRKILVEIQKGKDFSVEEEKLILETYKKHAGSDCEVEIRFINEFELTESGKRLFFLNKK